MNNDFLQSGHRWVLIFSKWDRIKWEIKCVYFKLSDKVKCFFGRHRWLSLKDDSGELMGWRCRDCKKFCWIEELNQDAD